MFDLEEDSAQVAEELEKKQEEQAKKEAEEEANRQAEEKKKEEKAKFSQNALLIIKSNKQDTLPVHGCQMVPNKLIGLMAEAWKILETPFIPSIQFTNDFLMDGNDNPLCGAHDHVTNALIVSVAQMLDDGTEDSSVDAMAVDAQIWVALLQTCLHEMAHAAGIEDEEKANDKALDILTSLAQKYDIETPAIPDMGWLGYKLDGFFSNIEDSDKENHKLQRQMKLEEVVYTFKSGKRLFSLREWVRVYNKDRAYEEAWDEEPIAVTSPAKVEAVTANVANKEGSAMPMSEGPAEPMPGYGTEAPITDPEEVQGPIGEELPGGNTEPIMPGHGEAPAANHSPAQPQSNGNQQKPWEKPSPFQPQGNCSAEELRIARRNVIISAFQVMFNNCGWDYRGGFTDSDYVARTEVNLAKMPNGEETLVGVDAIINGKKEYDIPSPGILRGFVGRAAGLPQYSIHLNFGNAVKRVSLVPQNPNKGSKPAAAAQGGEMIMWVIIEGTFVAKVTCPSGDPRSYENVTVENL